MAVIVLMTMAAMVVECKPGDDPENGDDNGNEEVTVTITTIDPSDITANTAICGAMAVVSEGGVLAELGVCWSTQENPTLNDAHRYTTIWNEPFVCTITDLESSTEYYVRAYALLDTVPFFGEQKSFVTDEDSSNNDHDYVDLGLPSGTLWAVCNVGADTPEGYGDYFAWGEIEEKAFYKWNNYKYCNGSNDQLTKYCSVSDFGYNGFTDTLTILQPMDDAATTNWGEGWCTPTVDQWKELKDNTVITWFTLNDVEGRLFTASNGNSLFLPANGYRWLDGLYLDGSDGSYRSSSLVLNYPYCTWAFSFLSGTTGELDYGSRDYGVSVRPVRSLH